MIEIVVSGLGAVCGYLGAIWCFANLAWALFRNNAEKCLIYGIGTFAAIVVMLNAGGILNETTWGMFGACVFGLHLLYALFAEWSTWKVVAYGIMLTTSLLSLMGVL